MLYSAALRERLKRLGEKGYTVQKGILRCIAAWKQEDDAEETAVLLPDLYLGKTAGSDDE